MERAYTLRQIAEMVGGELAGDPDLAVTGVASVSEAGPGDIVFAESVKFAELAAKSKAAAVLISDGVPVSHVKPLVRVPDARMAFVKLLAALERREAPPAGIHPTAVIGANVSMAVGVSVGAHAVIGDGVVLSTAVTVGSGCSIGAGVSIGERSVLHPNVTLYPHVIIGARCILHAGVVIGADGFGYVPVGVELMRVPHLGSVRIEDDVEVGANTCVDRAKTGETVIGKGTKLDNLIHVAHNVHIGRSCLIIAQVGIAGSVTIGDGVILAGQAGIADHIDIGSGAKVAAQGGVIGDVPAGVTVSGYPARPHATKMREHAASASLPDYIKRVRALEKRLAQLEAALGQADRSST